MTKSTKICHSIFFFTFSFQNTTQYYGGSLVFVFSLVFAKLVPSFGVVDAFAAFHKIRNTVPVSTILDTDTTILPI